MSEPELAKQFQGALRQRHVAVLAPVAVTDVDQQAGRIDVGDLQTGTLPEAQTAGVEGDQTNPVAEEADAAQDVADFLRAEDDRELLFAGRAD